MNIFKKIGDGLKEGVSDTKFKADQFMRVQQMEGEIKSLARELSEIREQLSMATYSLYLKGQLPQAELKEYCDQIGKINEQIGLKQKQIDLVKSEKPPSNFQVPRSGLFCTNCGATVPMGSEFCMNCGQQLGNQPE